MSSTLRALADSLATGLQSVTWGITSTVVERKNWANVDVDAMASPRVFVIPGSADVTRISRQMMQVDYTVSVFVGRHVSTDADVDGMLDLADSVMLQVRAHSFGAGVTWPAGVTSPQAVGIDLNPDDALTERNVWRAVITATYRVFETNVLPTPTV
jgi:hypothetical protein